MCFKVGVAMTISKIEEFLNIITPQITAPLSPSCINYATFLYYYPFINLSANVKKEQFFLDTPLSMFRHSGQLLK